jgi:hypothetical protein
LIQNWFVGVLCGHCRYYRVDGDTLGAKVAAWAPHVALTAKLHQQYKKPVCFTEIGYCSGHCSRTHAPSAADYTTHAEQYEAVFEAFRNHSPSPRHRPSHCSCLLVLLQEDNIADGNGGAPMCRRGRRLVLGLVLVELEHG